ncbi:MAG: ABC transporter substrate-binding protein [Deltaproteobacteria bacterium]|nr:ABC transporter substrate-binding protein [Deltaproteobacteria bacterium]
MTGNSFLLGLVITVVLLTCVPAAASDYTLDIFGNANEDDTIDLKDVECTESIVLGLNDQTQFADARYDGEIDILDVTQIELTILGSEKKLTFLDDHITENCPNGKPVTIKKPVERMIVLSTYGTEAVRSLKSADRIIGVPTYTVTEHAQFFPELVELPTIGSGFKPDIEKVIELDPDMVIAYATSPKPEEFEDKLPESVTVVHLDFSRADLMIEDFAKLGYILGKRDEAEEIADFYREFDSSINEQIGKLSEDEKPGVYIESIWNSESEYKAIGKNSGTDNAVTMAGGVNIADFDDYKTIDAEWVIAQDPDVIIAQVFTGMGCGYEHDEPSGLKAVRQSIMNRPELAGVTAVKENRVYCISIQVTTKPRYFIGVAYMAKWLHPELFEDLDPHAVNEEYLERYQGVPYQGIYMYPVLAEN